MGRPQRKIEDESEARRCLAEVEAAGERIVDWARTHGIDGRSLNAWRVNLSRSSGTAAPRRRSSNAVRQARAGLVELVARKVAIAPGRYVIWLGDVAVEVGDDFREATLARIATALRSC